MKVLEENVALELEEKDLEWPIEEFGAEIVQDVSPKKFTGALVITDTYAVFCADSLDKVEYLTQTRWAVSLFVDPSDPEGWTTAEVIALPGIASEGKTRDEAIMNICEALHLAIEEAGPEGLKIQPGEHELPEGARVIYVAAV